MRCRVPGSLFNVLQNETPTEHRRRASKASKAITEALCQAITALIEAEQERESYARFEARNPNNLASLHRYRLDVAGRDHLRQCVRLAEEMQQAMTLAVGSWVLGDDIAGTGLSDRELSLLRAAAGYSE